MSSLALVPPLIFPLGPTLIDGPSAFVGVMSDLKLQLKTARTNLTHKTVKRSKMMRLESTIQRTGTGNIKKSITHSRRLGVPSVGLETTNTEVRA